MNQLPVRSRFRDLVKIAAFRDIGTKVAFVAYSLLVIGPIAMLVVTALPPVLTGQIDWLSLVLPSERRFGLLLNSLILASCVSGTAMMLGWLGGIVFWGRISHFNKSFAGLFLPLVALPPYIHTLTWMTFLATLNRVFAFTPGTNFSLYGFGATFGVEVMAYTPLALCFSWLSLKNIDPDLIESGRINHSDEKTLIRIVLPLCKPILLTGGLIIFILSLLDYSVPSLLQFNVYSLEVFAEYAATNQAARAFWVAFPLLIISTLIVLLLLKPLRMLILQNLTLGSAWSTVPQWPKWLSILLRTNLVVLCVMIILPLLTIVLSGSPFVLASLPNSDMSYSLVIALAATSIGLPIAALTAKYLLSASGHSFLWVLIFAPLAVPASLLGGGVNVVSQNIFHISGDAILIWANLARFLPMMVLIMIAQLRRIDTLLFDAARILQPGLLQRHIYVSLPLLAPGILGAMGVMTLFSLGELGTTLMVIPPGRTTITLRIYNYLHYGASESVAGLTLILMIVVIGMGGLTALFLQSSTSLPGKSS